MKILRFLKIRIDVLFAGVVMILSGCALVTDRFPVSSTSRPVSLGSPLLWLIPIEFLTPKADFGQS